MYKKRLVSFVLFVVIMATLLPFSTPPALASGDIIPVSSGMFDHTMMPYTTTNNPTPSTSGFGTVSLSPQDDFIDQRPFQELSLTSQQLAISQSIFTALQNFDCESVYNIIAGNLATLQSMCTPTQAIPYPFAYIAYINNDTVYLYSSSISSNGWSFNFAVYTASTGTALAAWCREDTGSVDTINGNNHAVLNKLTYVDGVANGEFALKQGSNLRWDFRWKLDGNAVNGKREGRWLEDSYIYTVGLMEQYIIEYVDGKVVNGELSTDGYYIVHSESRSTSHGVDPEEVAYVSHNLVDHYLALVDNSPEQSKEEPIQPASSEYIYDTTDPGAALNLPIDRLATVTDRNTAIAAINAAASGMTDEQKQSPTGIDLVTLYAEEAVAQAASTTFSGSGITISQANVQALQATANETRAAAEQALASNGVAVSRDIRADVKFRTSGGASLTITIEPSAANASVDGVRVETPDYIVSFSADSIKANAADSPLVVTITEVSPGAGASSNARGPEGQPYERLAFPGSAASPGILFLADEDTKTEKVDFNKTPKENVKLSMTPAKGDTTHQAIMNSKGDAKGGKFNPVNGKIEAKIKDSDSYTVKNNKKNFSDISSKSQEMQNAINILASKGVINGTAANEFSPDKSISRAEIAALIVRTLSKVDPNADGGFTDVVRTDWFFGEVGSAKRFGIVNGISATTFAPNSTILKDQIVAICARTLRAELGYRNPSNVSGVLSVYKDAGSIAQWGLEDIALATRENLVVRRTDGTFGGSATMTRGDAAIILYRMFMRIW